jgi:uncharacterized SAM-binding protein YcdF (DUF218 family)
MHYYLTKIAWFLVQPSSFIAFCFVLGGLFLYRNRFRQGRRLITLGALLYVVLGFFPVGNMLLTPLEEATKRPALDTLHDLSGVIVLGGAMDTLISHQRVKPEFNDAGDRMIEALSLARRFPDLPIVFSGGNTEILFDEDSEAEVARRFFAEFGITEPRLKLEGRSRNTAENAKFTADLLHPQKGQRWLLLTSAFHMMRAQALFQAQGFDVIPWPVDYRTSGPQDRLRFFSSPWEGLMRSDIAVKERISYYYSWLRGDLAPRS